MQKEPGSCRGPYRTDPKPVLCRWYLQGSYVGSYPSVFFSFFIVVSAQRPPQPSPATGGGEEGLADLPIPAHQHNQQTRPTGAALDETSHGQPADQLPNPNRTGLEGTTDDRLIAARFIPLPPPSSHTVNFAIHHCSRLLFPPPSDRLIDRLTLGRAQGSKRKAELTAVAAVRGNVGGWLVPTLAHTQAHTRAEAKHVRACTLAHKPGEGTGPTRTNMSCTGLNWTALDRTDLGLSRTAALGGGLAGGLTESPARNWPGSRNAPNRAGLDRTELKTGLPCLD